MPTMTEDYYNSDDRTKEVLERARAAAKRTATPRVQPSLVWMTREQLEAIGIEVPPSDKGCVGSRDCPHSRKDDWMYLVLTTPRGRVVVTDKKERPQIRCKHHMSSDDGSVCKEVPYLQKNSGKGKGVEDVQHVVSEKLIPHCKPNTSKTRCNVVCPCGIRKGYARFPDAPFPTMVVYAGPCDNVDGATCNCDDHLERVVGWLTPRKPSDAAAAKPAAAPGKGASSEKPAAAAAAKPAAGKGASSEEPATAAKPARRKKPAAPREPATAAKPARRKKPAAPAAAAKTPDERIAELEAKLAEMERRSGEKQGSALVHIPEDDLIDDWSKEA